MDARRPLLGSPSPLRRRLALDRLAFLLAGRRQLLLAYAVALVPALAFAFTQPVWSRVDEAQHADVLAQYTHGVYPVMGQTTLRPDIVVVMRKTGVYQWWLPNTEPQPAVTDPAAFTPVPSGLSGTAEAVWIKRHLWWFSYESMQAPLFYCLAAPVWGAAGAIGGTWSSIFAVRALNALLLALLAPTGLATARLLVPGSRLGPPFTAGTLAILPGLVLNGTAITNDTLVAVLGGLLALATLAALVRGWTHRSAAGAGILLGATVLAKLDAAGLALPLLVALAWPVVAERRHALAQLVRAALAGAACLAVISPWLLVNRRAYGAILPSAAVRKLLRPVFGPPPASAGQLLRSWKNAFSTFWTGEPYNTLPLVRPLAVVVSLLCLAALVGLLWTLARRGQPLVRPAGVVVCVTAVLGCFVGATGAQYLSGVGGYVPGRYLYPAVAPAVALGVAGLLGLARQGSGPRALSIGLGATYAGLSLLNLGGFLAGWTGTPAGTAPPPASAQEVAVRGETADGDLQLTADRLLVDRAHRTLQLHVRVRNAGTTEVEWWPVPYLQMRGVDRSADYSASTHFRSEVDPGEESDGWISFVNVDAAADTRFGPFRVIFPEVAREDYHRVDDVVLPVAPAGVADASRRGERPVGDSLSTP